VREALPAQSIEPIEIKGKRDILTAPVDRDYLPPSEAAHQRLVFELWEYLARNAAGPFRHWIQRLSGHYPASLWERQDIALTRHLRFRQLMDAILLAGAESTAGRVSVAHAVASEATRLGDEREPMRAIAHDLSELT